MLLCTLKASFYKVSLGLGEEQESRWYFPSPYNFFIPLERGKYANVLLQTNTLNYVGCPVNILLYCIIPQLIQKCINLFTCILVKCY